MTKVLVTGANGYLGSGVVRQLLNDGITVIATDVSVQRIDNRAIIVPCDIFELDDPFEYFEKPDVLLHMAWRDGFVHWSDRHIFDLPFHYSFLSKMINSGIKHVACMGTMHEIGYYEGCISDSTPCNPCNPYGISKNALRSLLELQCNAQGSVFQWLRGFYIVGNSSTGNSIFSKIVQAANKGDNKFPFTTGSNQYDFLDYETFCKYVAAAVEQSEIDGIINICSGHPITLAERVEQFIIDNHFDIELQYGAYPDRPYDSKALWGDNSKIKMIEEKRSERLE